MHIKSFILICLISTTGSFIYPVKGLEPLPDSEVEMLTRAWPDEFFYGLGDPRNQYVRGGISPADPADPNWPEGATPKVNQSYVWGLTKFGNNLFFGTHANGHLAFGNELLGSAMQSGVTDLTAAEYGLGVYGQKNGLPEAYGDWRPPLLARYDITNNQVYDLTERLPLYAKNLLYMAQGFRCAGILGRSVAGEETVVLAGPPIDPLRGLLMFTFNARTGEFISAMEVAGYNNIRRFAEYGNDLYAGVEGVAGIGAVIRVSPRKRLLPVTFPAYITEVGKLDLPGCDIAIHEGRIFVCTWPWIGSPDDINMLTFVRRLLTPMGIWMSPRIPRRGLTPLHGKRWQKVWSISHYEPDMLVALTCGGGAMQSYGGWLYFGTMQPPAISTLIHFKLYGEPATDLEKAQVVANTSRGTTLFRMRKFRSGPIRPLKDRPLCEVELLYGQETMNVYDGKTQRWVTTNNLMNKAPLMGATGFGNFQNIYTWSMNVYQGQLYLGTAKMGGVKIPSLAELLDPDVFFSRTYGGELYRLDAPGAPSFTPITVNGFDNPLNIGFRTLVSDKDGLFIGTANIYNLMGNQFDEYPDGGWEIWRLRKRLE